MLPELRQQVFEANIELNRRGVVLYTWGNVSGIDREAGLVVIKPSGVPYEVMTADDMVVVDLDNKVVWGDKNPSSDTRTHTVLYKAFPRLVALVIRIPGMPLHGRRRVARSPVLVRHRPTIVPVPFRAPLRLVQKRWSGTMRPQRAMRSCGALKGWIRLQCQWFCWQGTVPLPGGVMRPSPCAMR